jgi:KAP family P-loop domain
MTLDIVQFFKACNPSRTLIYGNPGDRKYYIDLATVRGSNLIQELKRTINLLPNERTCQLFTGHVGCGKSTELLRLKAELESAGFFVVYFESSEDLEMSDVDVTDILIAIAHQVSEKLEKIGIRLKPSYFVKLFTELGEALQTPIEFSQMELSVGISKITAKAKAAPNVRNQLRQYTEPQTNGILRSINEELLGKANEELKKQGKKGLVVIIDNLDRVDARMLQIGRTQPEYLFIDRGDQLSRLNCHVVYTIPLALVFSNETEALRQRFGGGISPKILPMVPVRTRGGAFYPEGVNLLRHMVLVRAFPDAPIKERRDLLPQVFDHIETLDALCAASGGHLRNLLGLICGCIQQSDPPFTREVVDRVIRGSRDALARAIDNDEWQLIFQVMDKQIARGELEYQTLLRSMFVFEYQDAQGSWFGINPVLRGTKQFQDWARERN